MLKNIRFVTNKIDRSINGLCLFLIVSSCANDLSDVFLPGGTCA